MFEIHSFIRYSHFLKCLCYLHQLYLCFSFFLREIFLKRIIAWHTKKQKFSKSVTVKSVGGLVWTHSGAILISLGSESRSKEQIDSIKIMARVPFCRLKNGLEIRRILNGMWQVSGSHGAIDSNKASREMFKYFDAGLTTFDMADIYGPAEEIFGDFLEQLRDERGEQSAGKVQGKFYFVSFLWNLKKCCALHISRT